jgi:hypothetical protein
LEHRHPLSENGGRKGLRCVFAAGLSLSIELNGLTGEKSHYIHDKIEEEAMFHWAVQVEHQSMWVTFAVFDFFFL